MDIIDDGIQKSQPSPLTDRGLLEGTCQSQQSAQRLDSKAEKESSRQTPESCGVLEAHRPRSMQDYLLKASTLHQGFIPFKRTSVGQWSFSRKCEIKLHRHFEGVCAKSAQFEDSEKATSNLDVGEAVISPAFRATPWQAEEAKAGTSGISIAFVSESNICRSPLAAAFMELSVHEHGLSKDVKVSSRATRDYTIGEGVHPSTVVAAKGLGVHLPGGFRATKFDYTQDTVDFDLILVMDKFTAGDVMREVSVFDTINKKGNYSQKVRRLGEFHPSLREGKGADAQDIDDPLYGNEGGGAEMESVAKVAGIVKEACEGLAKFLAELQQQDSSTSLRDLLKLEMSSMREMDWLAPPMLSRK